MGLSQFLSFAKPNSSSALTTCYPFVKSYFYGVRWFSFKASSDFGKRVNGDFAKGFFEKPATALNSAFSRYREAIGLQIDAFFRRNSLFLVGAGGVVLCALLWRIMFGIANTFVSFSEGMAKYGFLALSSAMVAFAVSSFCQASYCPLFFAETCATTAFYLLVKKYVLCALGLLMCGPV